MYVTVKLFGIPREARTIERINAILNEIGQPSDLGELSNSSILHDELFVAARAKIDVTRPATAKVFVPISDTTTIIVFVHYMKVQRICLARINTVLPPNPTDVQKQNPFQVHGAWMTQLSQISMDYVIRQIRSAVSAAAQPSTLSKLRSVFGAPSTALRLVPSDTQMLIQPEPPQQQQGNQSALIPIAAASLPEIQAGAAILDADTKMEDRIDQPEQVEVPKQVNQNESNQHITLPAQEPQMQLQTNAQVQQHSTASHQTPPQQPIQYSDQRCSWNRGTGAAIKGSCSPRTDRASSAPWHCPA